MNMKPTVKPKRWHLYHWNASDGFLGRPTRKIHIQSFTPCLLHVAYLAGGADWKNPPCPEKSILGLILDASPFSQPDEYYYRHFDLYQTAALRQQFSASVTPLVECDRARWQVECNCLGMPEAKIDPMIEAIVTWHYQEIQRIVNVRPSFFSP